MEERKNNALRWICAAVSGMTAMYIGAETLICLVSLLGLSHPESGIYAVNTLVIQGELFQISVFLLSLSAIIAYLASVRWDPTGGRFIYAVKALGVRLAVTVVAKVILSALALLGIDGGVDPLVPADGYLMRMVDPIVTVLSTAIILVFSVAFICAYLATVSEFLSSPSEEAPLFEDNEECDRSEESDDTVNDADGDGVLDKSME